MSEQWKRAAIRFNELHAAANLLEETKSAVLAQRLKALGDIPVTHAEREVKASEWWNDHLQKIVKARELAGLAQIERDFLKMRFLEWQSEAADRRTEARI